MNNSQRIEQLGSRYQNIWNSAFYSGGRVRQGQVSEVVLRAFFSSLLSEVEKAPETETIGTLDRAMSIALDAGDRFAKGPGLQQ